MKLSFNLVLMSDKCNLEEKFMSSIKDPVGFDTEIISAMAKILSLSMKLSKADEVSIVSFNVSKIEDTTPEAPNGESTSSVQNT